MTPNARKKHILALKAILIENGFQEDRWDNYLYPGVKDKRFKFKKVNLRKERKLGGKWLSGGFSKTMSKIDLDQFRRYIKGMVKNMNRPIKPLKVREISKEESKVLIDKIIDKNKEREANENKRLHLYKVCYLLLSSLMERGDLERLRIDPEKNKDYPHIKEVLHEITKLNIKLEK